MEIMPGRIRLKFRWYVFAAISGLVAATATYAWLNGPRWRDSSAGRGANPHFSQDGVTLTTFHGLRTRTDEDFAPRIVSWDTASGRLLSDVPLRLETPIPAQHNVRALLVPGEQRVLVEFSPCHFSEEPIPKYLMYDVRTGLELAGPFEVGGDVTAFSRDGRWCMSTRYLRVVDIATTTTAWPTATDDDREWLALSGAFAPDSKRFAVLWVPSSGGWGEPFLRRFIAIYELPSGREVRSFELPPRCWHTIRSWDSDDRLYLETGAEEPTDCGTSSFSMHDADIGSERPEPLRPCYASDQLIHTLSGDGWIAHVDSHDRYNPSAIEVFLWKLDCAIGTSFAGSSGVSIRVVDSTNGDVRADFARVGADCTISRDGRWIASAGDAVEVWSVPPPRAMLWATVAGFAVGFSVLGLGIARNRLPRM